MHHAHKFEDENGETLEEILDKLDAVLGLYLANCDALKTFWHSTGSKCFLHYAINHKLKIYASQKVIKKSNLLPPDAESLAPILKSFLQTKEPISDGPYALIHVVRELILEGVNINAEALPDDDDHGDDYDDDDDYHDYNDGGGEEDNSIFNDKLEPPSSPWGCFLDYMVSHCEGTSESTKETWLEVTTILLDHRADPLCEILSGNTTLDIRQAFELIFGTWRAAKMVECMGIAAPERKEHYATREKHDSQACSKSSGGFFAWGGWT